MLGALACLGGAGGRQSTDVADLSVEGVDSRADQVTHGNLQHRTVGACGGHFARAWRRAACRHRAQRRQCAGAPRVAAPDFGLSGAASSTQRDTALVVIRAGELLPKASARATRHSLHLARAVDCEPVAHELVVIAASRPAAIRPSTRSA